MGDTVIQMRRRRPARQHQDDALLLASEVADRLRVDESTVRRWTREGRIPFTRLGDSRGAPVRYPEADVVEWWRKRQQGGRL